MNKRHGFAAIAVIITLIVVLVGIGGYAYVNHGKQQTSISPSPIVASATPTSSATPSASPRTTNQPQANTKTKLTATASGLTVSFNCSVSSSKNLYNLYVYPGDNSGPKLVFDESFGPSGRKTVAKTGTIQHTYQSPGTYTATCVPDYEEEQQIAPESVNAGKTTVSVGAPQTPNSVSFSISPRTGTMPVQVSYSCSVNTNVNVVSIEIYRGQYGAWAMQEGETLADWTLAGEYHSDGSVPKSLSGQVSMTSNEYAPWKGSQTVACAVRLADGTLVHSQSIPISFQ